MYYNTTKEEGSQLDLFIEQAENQQDVIFNVFKSQKRPLSPSDVFKILNKFRTEKEQMLLTSIRRAITDLTSENKLIKTDQKKPGIYGRNEFIWKLNY